MQMPTPQVGGAGSFDTRTPEPTPSPRAAFGRFVSIGVSPRGWTLVVAILLAVMALPVATVIALAIWPAENIWPHLVANVLPTALADTAFLLIGTGALTLVAGTGTAWLVTMYRFRGRDLLDRLLVVPLAMPTYLVAYCYVELLDYSGPLQTGLRDHLGWTGPHDYWFPEIRSLAGAIVVLSAVLYPYVYLTARASFVQQSICVLEVARTLGRSPLRAFLEVALPLARPSLCAGVALVLMECLNDLGAVQYLGVRTLSASIYETWVQRSNLGGAAQIACAMMVLIFALFWIERLGRSDRRYHNPSNRYRSIPFADLKGLWGFAASIACLIPFLLGFVVPVVVLLGNAWRHLDQAVGATFLKAAANSLVLASFAALAAVTVAVVLAYAQRVAASYFTRVAAQFAGLGYALPGTVLALGLLIPLAAFDNAVDALLRDHFGISSGLLLSGTVIIVVLAYVIRFLAVSLAAIDAGLQRISPNLDAAARALGETPLSSLRRVHLPMLWPALGTAGLLVFVDGMKELPATLLLRPFNFETLATHIYSFAALERFEEAAFGALAIVAVGLIPVLLLHRTVASGRVGSGS